MQGKVFVRTAAALGFAVAVGMGTSPAAAQENAWAGPYVGALVGKGWANIDGPPSSGLGWTAGIFGGYNFNTPGNFLIGIDADVEWSGRGTAVYDNPWTSNVRVRYGYAWNSLFIYGAAGMSMARIGIGGDFATDIGWNIGAGLELRRGPLIARVEYLYSRFGEIRDIGHSANLHEVRIGIGIAF
ncbi:MAG: outer membrane beta-barrel protein [Bauldia sp.]